jgi:copper chaperone CopZ
METTKLKLAGLTCKHCIMRTTNALEGISGVKKAKVKLDNATVKHEKYVSAETLIVAVKEAGFEAEQAGGIAAGSLYLWAGAGFFVGCRPPERRVAAADR